MLIRPSIISRRSLILNSPYPQFAWLSGLTDLRVEPLAVIGDRDFDLSGLSADDHRGGVCAGMFGDVKQQLADRVKELNFKVIRKNLMPILNIQLDSKFVEFPHLFCQLVQRGYKPSHIEQWGDELVADRTGFIECFRNKRA